MTTTNLLQLLVNEYNKPDPRPYLFEVGQTVRVVKSVVNDGQTPKHWAGATGSVERRKTTGLHKDHWYVVRHATGNVTCEFREDELDRRYARRVAAPPAAGEAGMRDEP